MDFGWSSVEFNSTEVEFNSTELHRSPPNSTEIHLTPPNSNRSPPNSTEVQPKSTDARVVGGVTLFGELVIVPDESILDFVGFAAKEK